MFTSFGTLKIEQPNVQCVFQEQYGLVLAIRYLDEACDVMSNRALVIIRQTEEKYMCTFWKQTYNECLHQQLHGNVLIWFVTVCVLRKE